MKIIKLFTGPDNKSYFEEMPCSFPLQKELGNYSEKYAASGFMLRESLPGATFEWHNAPQPQYIVYLEGQVEVEASGGETRVFNPGDILFATDLTGEGHISRILTKGRSIVITTQ